MLIFRTLQRKFIPILLAFVDTTVDSQLLGLRIHGRMLKPPRGMHDMLPSSYRQFEAVVHAATSAAARWGYSMMQTPLVEQRSVFSRSLGDASDVVMKEMYHVVGGVANDIGAEDLILRPEMTASAMRALLGSPLLHDLPQRWMYCGSMYRHERPQKGRLRQFHQLGVELLGSADCSADVEAVVLAAQVLNVLFGADRSFVLRVNSLGDTASRNSYRDVLHSHFTSRVSELSPDSTSRLQRGAVLRILDSKSDSDKAAIQDAPIFSDFLNQESKDRHRRVLDAVSSALEMYGLSQSITFVEDQRLVRGLDYYSHTCFEFQCAAPELGASQSTVLAGGRYDDLSTVLGGPRVPAIGWAAGVERLMLLRYGPDDGSAAVDAGPRPMVVVGNSEVMRTAACVLRKLNLRNPVVHLLDEVRLDKALKRANRLHACHIVFEALGENDALFIVRDMDSRTQDEVASLQALENWAARCEE